MAWRVFVLKEFEEDLKQLSRTHGVKGAQIEDQATEEFEDPFKGERVTKLLTSGTSTAAVAKLDGSMYPTSIRLQVLQDYRVTAWLFPAQSLAMLVHAFHKSVDPNYKRCVPTHDGRLQNYFENLAAFASKRKQH